MNNITSKFFILLFAVLTLPYTGSSLDSLAFDLSYDVHKVYPYISISEEKLIDAHRLTDLNSRYKSSWVSRYISVEVSTIQDGKVRKSMGKNDVLNQEQKALLKTADVGSDISVRIQYIPKNNLKNNEAKEMDFVVAVNPKNGASYPEGSQQLRQYLKENAMDKTDDDTFKRYQLTAVQFTINEKGQIIDSHIVESSKDKNVDSLLLDAVCNMPDWKPASYANGIKAKETFVLTVGDMESCVVNLLNIRPVPP